jgi:hypothetical protein
VPSHCCCNRALYIDKPVITPCRFERSFQLIFGQYGCDLRRKGARRDGSPTHTVRCRLWPVIPVIEPHDSCCDIEQSKCVPNLGQVVLTEQAGIQETLNNVINLRFRSWAHAQHVHNAYPVYNVCSIDHSLLAVQGFEGVPPGKGCVEWV